MKNNTQKFIAFAFVLFALNSHLQAAQQPQSNKTVDEKRSDFLSKQAQDAFAYSYYDEDEAKEIQAEEKETGKDISPLLEEKINKLADYLQNPSTIPAHLKVTAYNQENFIKALRKKLVDLGTSDFAAMIRKDYIKMIKIRYPNAHALLFPKKA